MHETRALARLFMTAVLGTVLLGLAGCGSGSDDDAATPGTGTTAPSTDDDGSGDGDEVLDICAAVTAAEIGALVGGTVTAEEIPGGGCTFNQEDPRATSISLGSSVLDEGAGGFEGSITGIKGVLDGDGGQDVPGVGDAAFVATGTAMGGSNTQASGLVLVGSTVVQVTLVQATGLTADQVRTITVDTLKLAASKG